MRVIIVVIIIFCLGEHFSCLLPLFGTAGCVLFLIVSLNLFSLGSTWTPRTTWRAGDKRRPRRTWKGCKANPKRAVAPMFCLISL